jgi:hypothetical protein
VQRHPGGVDGLEERRERLPEPAPWWLVFALTRPGQAMLAR